MIVFDPNRFYSTQQLSKSSKKIVPLPVRIDEIVSKSTPPRLTTIDVRRDGASPLRSYHQAVIAAEGRVEEVVEIVDVVKRSEKDRVDTSMIHVGSEP